MVRSYGPPNILEVLDGVPLPASQTDLVLYAAAHDASEDVLDLIQAMPDRTYKNVRQINAALGRITDLPGTDNGFWNAPDNGPKIEASQRLTARLRDLGGAVIH